MTTQVNEAELARGALQLLQRANLAGAEVPAFLAISRWLEDVAGRGSPPPPDVVES